MARKITENPDENIDTEVEVSFDDLTIPDDYSENYIFDEEKETIPKNYEVWINTKKEIWRGRVLLIPYSKKKRIVNI